MALLVFPSSSQVCFCWILLIISYAERHWTDINITTEDTKILICYQHLDSSVPTLALLFPAHPTSLQRQDLAGPSNILPGEFLSSTRLLPEQRYWGTFLFSNVTLMLSLSAGEMPALSWDLAPHSPVPPYQCFTRAQGTQRDAGNKPWPSAHVSTI